MAVSDKKMPNGVEAQVLKIVEIVQEEIMPFGRFMPTAQDKAMMSRQFKGYMSNIEARVRGVLNSGRTDS